MKKLFRYGILLIVFFITFLFSGQLGLAAELHTQSVVAGAGLFSVSFIGITTSCARILAMFI